MDAKGFLFSSLTGLEMAAGVLFQDDEGKRRDESLHAAAFRGLAGEDFRFEVAVRVRDQVLRAIGGDGPLFSDAPAQAAFDAILEPVLVAVLRRLGGSGWITSEELDVFEQIAEEETSHSGTLAMTPEVYRRAFAGAVATLTCPYFARPLQHILGADTLNLAINVRELFSKAHAELGRPFNPDPARLFGFCPFRGTPAVRAEPSPWELQRTHSRFLGPITQNLEVRFESIPPRPFARIEAATAKAVCELVGESPFNRVRSSDGDLFDLSDPSVNVRRLTSEGLVNVPLPTHGAKAVTVRGFEWRTARRAEILKLSQKHWWRAEAPDEDLLKIPTLTGCAATVSSLARLYGQRAWTGFATPELDEGATFNVLVAGYVPGQGFNLSIASDHRAVDGHELGEFGIRLAARVEELLSSEE